jgi:cytidine deaminase
MRELIEEAKRASKFANSSHSGVNVGAALVTESGRIYRGANIESSSYSLTICAERVALFKALSEGEKSFSHLVIWAENEENFPPCGACRQVLFDFSPNLKVTYLWRGELVTKSIAELLPDAFDFRTED